MELALTLARLRCAPLDWEDAEALQALLESCAAYFSVAEGRPVSRHEGMERISEALGDAEQALLGVSSREGRSLLGLLDVRAHSPVPNAATIALLLIAPGARRQGHASALVAELLVAARSAGFESLHLGVRRGGAAAGAFWEAQGFTDVGRDSEITRFARRLS